MQEKLKQTSLPLEYLVNRSRLPEKEKDHQTKDGSGLKLLELLPKQNVDGVFWKMLTALLTSKKVKSCSKFSKTWKKRISKANVLCFQLQASALHTNAKEFSSSDIMLPTPTASCQMDVVAPPETVTQNSKGWTVTRKKTGVKFGAKLNDVVSKLHGGKGKLNPNFLEYLMAYPQGWTDLEKTDVDHLETQSFQKSQKKLEEQSYLQKMYRTPTAMDTQDEVLHFAAKWIKGKVKRASNSQVQKTLSMDVAIDYLNNNPLLIDQYDVPFKHRPKLPEKLEFIAYLKANTSIKELISKTDIPKTKIEHWFRKDKCFSYPSITDWNLIKAHLKKLKFNYEMTYEEEKDWQ
jgi:hypothetical protein